MLPALMAFYIFLTGWQVPQFVRVPTGQEKEFVGASAAFSGVCMVFFIFIIIVWAGSIISSRGVTMIKDAKLSWSEKASGKWPKPSRKRKKTKTPTTRL